MSFSYTDKIGLAKPSDGEQNWGDEVRQNFETIEEVISPENVYFVSPHFTTANLGNSNATSRRHFDTIQGAIDQYESDQAVDDPGHGAIIVYPGAYDEELTITQSVGLIAAANGPLIRGGARRPVLNSTSAGPSITISGQANENCYVQIVGFDIRNRQVSGNTINGPAFLSTNDNLAGNYPAFDNQIMFAECSFYNFANLSAFTHLFGVNPNWTLLFDGCELSVTTEGTALDYAIRLDGNATKPASLRARRSEFTHYAAAGTYTVTASTQSNITVYDCAFARDRASVVADDGGTHSNVGLASDAQATTYKNAFGVVFNTF